MIRRAPSANRFPRPPVTRAFVWAALLVLVALGATGIALNATGADPLPPVSVNVKLVSGLTPEDQAATVAGHGAVVKSALPKLNLVTAEIPGDSFDTVMTALQADPKVVRVEVNKKRKVEGRLAAGDPLDQWALPKIGWDQLNGVVPAAGAAKVAVLDTGIQADHIDLQGKVLPGVSMIDASDGSTDSNGHGTWLAGIVAAVTGNGEGIDGVAYDGVQVMPVKVLAADGTGQDSDVIAGVMWAADSGADVILMGFSNPDYSQSLQEAIDYAWDKGIVLVAAVGNDASSAPSFPAGLHSVMGVAATDQADVPASFSNTGSSVFLAAPGVSIPGPYAGNTYASWSGTSASAAIVAGAAAEMRAVFPALPNGVIVGRLARNAAEAGTAEQTGNGRLNMARAFADESLEPVQPVGAPPTGNGGPFVGPYRAAAVNITLVPTSGMVGDTVTVTTSGGGFKDLTATINFANQKVATCLPNSGGNVVSGCTFKVPTATSGDYTVTATGGTGGTPSTTFTVTGKTDPVITWSNPPDIVYGTPLGATQLNATASVAGAFTYNPGSATVLGAGNAQTLHVEFTPTNPTLYNVVSKDVTINVLRAPVTLSAGSYSGTYDGSAHDTSACVVTGSYNGALACANAPASVKDAGAGDVAPTLVLNGETATNFAVTDVKGHYSITAAPVTLAAGSYSGTYDGAPHNTSACAVTGIYRGALSCSNSPMSVGPNVGAGEVAPAVNLNGELADNFSVTPVSGSWSITAAPVTLTAGGYSGMYDGAPHDTSPCLVSANVPNTYKGALTCANAPASVKDAGAGDVASTLVLNGETAANFAVTNVKGHYRIAAAPVTLTAGSYSGTYDGSAHDASACVVTGTYTGALSCSNSPTSVGPNVGAGEVAPAVNLNGELAGNFSVTPMGGSWSITAAPVTLTAGGYSGTYDGSAHDASACVVTGTYTGALSCSNSPRSVGPNVGAGEVTPAVNLNGELAGNFSVTPMGGSWSITAAPVTLTAGGYSGTYDGAPHDTSTCVVTGTYTGALSCSNSPTSVGPNVGAGEVAPAVNLNAEIAGNFSVTPMSGSWTITAAPVTLTAGNYSGTYDGSAHDTSACLVTGTYKGALACANAPALVKDAGAGDVAPTLVLSGETATNFAVTDVKGHYSIAAAPVTLTAGNYSGTYDGSTHATSACVVTGTYTSALSCSNSPTSVGPNVGAGEVAPAVDLNGELAGNFSVTPMGGSWSITAAPVTLTGGNYSGTYDGSAHDTSACLVTGTYTGALSCSNSPTSVGPNVGAGEVAPAVNLNGELAGNFWVTPMSGSWSITAAPVMPTAGNYSGTYDGSAHATSACVVTGTYTGALSCSNSPTSVGPNIGAGEVAPAVNLNGELAGNFSVTPMGGSWSITAAPVTLTAGGYSGTYDGAPHDTSACLVSANVPNTYKGALTCANAPASVKDAGAGDVAPILVLNGEMAANFAVTDVKGHYSIAAAPVTLTAGNYSGAYDGSAHTTSACVVTGTYKGALSCSNSPTSVGPNVGAGEVAPAVNLNGELAGNFSVTPVSQSWSITAASVTATAGSGSATYDGSAKTPSACVVTGHYTGDLACTNDPATAGPNAGTTTTKAVVTGTALANFTIASVDGSFLIKKAPTTTTVTVADATYDGTPHGGTALVTGASLNLQLPVTYQGVSGTVFGPSSELPTNPGTYAASASYSENLNYLSSSDTKTFRIGYGVCSPSVGAGGVILPPIKSDGTSVYNRKGGSTIPVKFRVCDASGNAISNPAAVFGPNGAATVTMLNAVRGTITDINESTTLDIPDAAFRWDASGLQWMFNMATSNLIAGTATYDFRINLASGSSIPFRVGLK